MKTIKTFKVHPAIPDRLKSLKKIANNIWWTWTPKAIDLFRGIDLDLWTKYGHNPVKLLGSISQERFKELEESESFCSNMDLVEVELDWHLFQPTWFTKVNPSKKDYSIAYFSAEYGLHESLPLYSGGLGVLSGDHLKSADELGIPLVGIGLAYQQGYFHQFLNADGWQQEVYPDNDFHNMPITLVMDEDDKPIEVQVEMSNRTVYAQVWLVNVGRNPLYLMDTNIDKNSPEDREITYRLYGGDKEMRIKQEILLGIGGVRVLRALKLNVKVYHMNEGHSAFMAVERLREYIENDGLSFDIAKEVVSSSNVFTTHTPVPAGLDKFQFALIDQYISPYYNRLGISRDQFIALGKTVDNDNMFGMANFAISLSDRINGVSELHADVSKRMWYKTWPEVPFDEVPIHFVTNGIHSRSWLSDEITRLFERYLGPLWSEDPVNKEVWQRVDMIPDTELWRSKERLKERLVAFARDRYKSELKRIGAPQFEIRRADEALDPEALTICFARRFATYKRATLIFRDLDRLAKILNDKEYPVQIIFAGKAHPKDNEGKEFIRQINHIVRDERFRTKIMFIEDYDINIARYMVQGTDVWLNTPRRPLEASGTSGMKAAANGVLNLSILDGWWCEGYNGKNGWAIGGGEEYDDLHYQDEVESNALYDLLEQELVPLYYRRGNENLPREWISRVKDALKTLAPVFNTNRMVQEYSENFYFPAAQSFQKMTENSFEKSKQLIQWKQKIDAHWSKVKIHSIDFTPEDIFEVGAKIDVTTKVFLSDLTPDDVLVELYYGLIDSKGELYGGKTIEMNNKKDLGNGEYELSGEFNCTQSGKHGLAVRLLPKHEDLGRKFTPGYIYWA